MLAEGATTPETLRQKDCNNFKIWREVHKDKKGTHRRGWLYVVYDRSSQVPMTDGAQHKECMHFVGVLYATYYCYWLWNYWGNFSL